MLTQNKINFAARFEYLKALEQHRPEVLNYLHRPTFAVYRTYLQANPKSTAIQTLARLSTALSQGVSPELSKVDQALRQWVNAHNLQDRWIWEPNLTSPRSRRLTSQTPEDHTGSALTGFVSA
jgi:hypothetical protein